MRDELLSPEPTPDDIAAGAEPPLGRRTATGAGPGASSGAGVSPLETNGGDLIGEEGGLRPRHLEEFVGQRELKEHLSIILEAARRREQAVDHLLFAGPPGLGKTTLSGIVAAELGVALHVTSGPALERAGDLAALLTRLGEGDVLFIDEIHRLSRNIEEVLYPAMEDFQLDIVLGKGPAARSIRLDLPRFTLVGATTRTGLITGPLRDRFGLVARLDYYQPDELEAIVSRAAGILGIAMINRVRPRSPVGPAAHLASPIVSFVVSATTPRFVATVPSMPPQPTMVSPCSASTRSDSTKLIGRYSETSARSSAAVPLVSARSPSASEKPRRPSRMCTNRSSFSWDSSCEPREVEWPLLPHGPISDCTLRRAHRWRPIPAPRCSTADLSAAP